MGHSANIAARFHRRRGISRVRGLVVLCAVLTACLAERGPFTNRMAHSGTSYLARAARQPVSWQPWGRDAFALAAKLDRPVLLYIGSDACRWCAETDRAIYTDAEIGALINALFVPIRVDRDERPEVAQRYQAAVERLAGLHGWPLTVFLTADGSPFFGGTYFPADDPITGRGLKQLLPEIAKRYRDQRPFIVQQAALLRQLVLTTGESRGVLRPSLIRAGIDTLTRDLNDAVIARTTAGSVMHVEAASLLLTEYARDRDTLGLTVARGALDLMLDTTAIAVAEDPPRLVRAALVGALAKAWVVTGESRYREAGRALVRDLAHELHDLAALTGEGAVFADQEAYIVENLIMAAATLGEPSVEKRARAALDVLLQRTYARGWGVRHAMAGGSAGTTPQGLLQDQVQVAAACLAAHQVTNEPRYLAVAIDLAAIVDRSYADSLGGYFDTAEPPPGLGDRTKHIFDDMLPGPNAGAARVLARLADVTGAASYRRRAQATLEAFAGTVAGGAGLRATTFLAAARETLATP